MRLLGKGDIIPVATPRLLSRGRTVHLQPQNRWFVVRRRHRHRIVR